MEWITVIIPTFNREKVVVNSIKSIINQTYQQCKIIVVDDGSDDNTEDVIKNLGISERVTYIKTPQNSGPAAARNMGARLADTKWIAFNDSDDVWHEDKLEKQMKYANEHPEYDMIYTGYRGYHVDGLVTSTPDRDSQAEFEGHIYKALLLRNSIGTPTVLVNREEFIGINGFDETYKCIEDWDFVIRFSKNHKIGFVDEDLVDAYISNSGVSMNIADYYMCRCRIVKNNLQALLEYNLFDKVVEDIFVRANNRGILPQVQSMLELVLKQ